MACPKGRKYDWYKSRLEIWAVGMAGDAVTVFFSYSHKDEALRDELANHLKILKLEGVITDWHDRQILPGDEWDKEIKESLNSAQIILLLISSDFIASQYCWDIEIARAVERHESGEACVIPIILRSCMWSSAPFGKLQALPKNATPVTSKAWPSKDEAFTNVAEGIKKTASDIQQKLKAERQGKLNQYEVAYRQAIQYAYPLNDAVQGKLNRLQEALGLADADIAPIITRLSAQYGEARQKLEKYRQEVRMCLEDDNGELSGLSRSILAGYRSSFGLTVEEATAVEQEELQPYKAKAEAVAQYEKVFTDTLQHENPLSEGTRRRLQRFQQTLALSDDKVEAIEMPLLKVAEQERQKQEKNKYANSLRQYEQEFAKAVETKYPLSQRVIELLKTLQHQLGLIDSDVAPLERAIKDKAEANHHKELHECEPSKLLFMKNIRDPNGGWSYTLDRIEKMGGSPESRVFEMYWLLTSKGAHAPSKGDLMILNQQAKVTHIVEMLDDEVRATESGYFRWVRIVWMPEDADWAQLPHQRDILGFDPPQFGGGTAYSFNSPNFGKFRAAWDSLEAFQQHIFQRLTKPEKYIFKGSSEGHFSSTQGTDYSKLRDLLKAGKWKAADQETYEVMIRVLGKQSGDVFTAEELMNFPSADLLALDELWVSYSQGRFGFSIQKEIYVKCGAKLDNKYPGDKVWHTFCENVGWREHDRWLTHSDVTFDTTAPYGHLPFGGGGWFRWGVPWREAVILFSRIETCRA